MLMLAIFRRYAVVALVMFGCSLNINAQIQSVFHNNTAPGVHPTNNIHFAQPNPSVCGLNFPIFDNSCTASHEYDILISGLVPDQLGVNVILEEVRIIIQHTWNSDLDITLKSPNNVVIELSTDNGSGTDNYGDPSDNTCSNYTAFTMSGCQLITGGVGPFIGSYVPEGDFDDFHDGSNPNGIWTLQVCDDAPDDVGVLHFVELVFSEVVCSVPTDLAVENFDSTSVELTWLTDTCTQTIIEYGAPGFSPGNGASAGGGVVVSVPCPVSQPFQVDGLTPETEYEIYVRTACPSGGFTKNSCPAFFKTDCTTPPITLSENFDAQTLCGTSCATVCEITGLWSNSNEDDFDWLVDENGTISGSTGPSDDVTGGGNYIYIETSGTNCQDGNRADLVSNCLQFIAESESCHLSFYYHMYGATVGTLNLDISTDEGLSWTNLWSLTGNQGDRWEKVFIDLSAYDSQVGKLRFSGYGGDSFSGDMAIDNIQLYGSIALGDPSFTYYLDNDGDGFGDLNTPLLACATTPPQNYVANADDCDDSNNLVNPNATEIPCNGIDENCNGMADDPILPDPAISNTDACYGASALLMGAGDLYWFDAAEGGNLIHAGNEFQSGILTEDTVFYVIDSLDASCKSQRIAVNVTVNQNPDLATNDAPVICAGESFDLESIVIFDANNTNGVFTFHSGTPADSSNQLTNPVVSPTATQSFFILSTTSAGCTDELEVEIMVNSTPEVSIHPADTTRICKNKSQILTANYEGGGLPPFSYEWSNGSPNLITAIAAGSSGNIETVWFSISDANGCNRQDTVYLETVESITTAASNSVDVTSCGGNDGSITITPLDGIPPYEISWSGPVNGTVSNINGSYTIENLEQGAYSVHISDNNPYGLDCNLTIPIIIVNGPSATVDSNIITTPAGCAGAEDGAIDISVSGNAPIFLWSNDATTEDISGIPAGFYSVTITDGLCNNIISDIEVIEPDTFSYNFTISQPDCFGGNNGEIDLNLAGGTAPYNILWNNNENGTQVSDLEAGNYTFTLTDANGCQFNSDTIIVTQPALIEFDVVEVIHTPCFESGDGSIDIGVSGGTLPFQYFWSNGAITKDLDQLSAGDYNLTVVDANGCSGESPVISITEPESLAYNILTFQAPSCNNLSDGIIGVEISGGTSPFSYEWSNGNETAEADSLAQGIYSLTVTDLNGCEIKITELELVAPNVMTIEPEFLQNNFCFGLSDGEIDVSVSGGTAPYNFLWSNDATSEDLDGLEAGTYQLAVTDANGCTAVSSEFLIVENNFFEATPDLINPVSCNAFSNGSIYLSMNGGTAPFSYDWNNGEETEDIENLPPGDYFATITDANGCISHTDTFVISEPAPLLIDIISVESPICNGLENGSIEVQVSGGGGNYIYSWNNGVTSEDLSNIPAGMYQLTILDGNDCVASSEIIDLTQPEIIQIGVDTVVNVSCSGIEEGSIEINVAGGITPYQFDWSNGEVSQNLEEITSGFYAVTVTDFNGCSAILSSIEVEQLNEGFQIEPDMVVNVSCNNAQDGSISISLTGGTQPFQYNWSNGIITSENDNLQGGTYDVTVTDANGCVSVSSLIEISEPDPLQYVVADVGHNDCFEASDGFLEIDVSGGTDPYSFLWSHGDTTQNAYDLSAGLYELTVTDANGCSTTTANPLEIQAPLSNIEVSVLSQNHVLCYGLQNGSISLSVTGGLTPYHFLWNNGDTTSAITQLSGGIYICEVSDANFCVTEEIVVEIIEPDMPLNVDSVLVTDVFLCNDSTGSISVFMGGGTPEYNYLWSNGDTTGAIENLHPGFYEFTVTDQNGCFLNSETYQIDTPPDDIELVTGSTPETLGFSNGTATVEASGGTPPYIYQWDGNANSQIDPTATGLSTGAYEVTVTDARNCIAVASVEVEFITKTDLPEIVEQIKLFPNPTDSKTRLQMKLSTQAAVTLEVFSVLGNRLFLVEKQTAELDELINLSHFAAGVYYLKISIDDHTRITRKIVFTP